MIELNKKNCPNCAQFQMNEGLLKNGNGDENGCVNIQWKDSETRE